jgi:hypothetical protein
MVPISLAGWGVREVVFNQAFNLAGVAQSQALALSLFYDCLSHSSAACNPIARLRIVGRPVAVAPLLETIRSHALPNVAGCLIRGTAQKGLGQRRPIAVELEGGEFGPDG